VSWVVSRCRKIFYTTEKFILRDIWRIPPGVTVALRCAELLENGGKTSGDHIKKYIIHLTAGYFLADLCRSPITLIILQSPEKLWNTSENFFVIAGYFTERIYASASPSCLCLPLIKSSSAIFSFISYTVEKRGSSDAKRKASDSASLFNQYKYSLARAAYGKMLLRLGHCTDIVRINGSVWI